MERRGFGADTGLDGAMRWLAIVAMMSGACCIGLIFNVLPPVLHQIAEHLGGGARATLGAQMMVTMPSIGLVLGGAASSWIVGRIGPRALLIGGLLLYMVSGSVGLYLLRLDTLYASRIVLGFAAAGVATAANALIGQYFSGASRGRMISAATVVGSALCVVAILASGRLAEILGWQASFAIYIAAPLPLLVAALVALPRAARAVAATTDSAPSGSTGRVFALLWPHYLLITIVYVVLMMTSTQVAFLLVENGIVSPSIQARVIGTSAFFIIAGALLYGWLQGRFGPSVAFNLGLILLGSGIAGFGFAHDAWTASLASALKGTGSGLLNSGFIHLVLNRAPPELRGKALGIMTSAMFLGDFINPLVVAPLKLWLGLHAAFIVIGFVVLGGAVFAMSRVVARRRGLAAA